MAVLFKAAIFILNDSLRIVSAFGSISSIKIEDKMTAPQKSILRLSFPIILGGLLGYAYYFFIGCKNGCPIQSNPLISTIYGALLGGIIFMPTKKKKTNPES